MCFTVVERLLSVEKMHSFDRSRQTATKQLVDFYGRPERTADNI